MSSALNEKTISRDEFIEMQPGTCTFLRKQI